MLLRNGIIVFLLAVLFASFVGCQPDTPKSTSELDTIYYKDNDFFEFNGADTYILDVIRQVSPEGVVYNCAYMGNRQNETLWTKQSKIDLAVEKWTIYAKGDQRWKSQPLDPNLFSKPDSLFKDGVSYSKSNSYVVPAVGAGLVLWKPGLGALWKGLRTGWKFGKGTGWIFRAPLGAMGASTGFIAAGTLLYAGLYASLYYSYKSTIAFIVTLDGRTFKSQIFDPSATREINNWAAFKKALDLVKNAEPMAIDATCPTPNEILSQLKTHRDFSIFQEDLSPSKTFGFKTPDGKSYHVVLQNPDDEYVSFYRIENGKYEKAYRLGALKEFLRAIEVGVKASETDDTTKELLVPDLTGFWNPESLGARMSADENTVGALPVLFEKLSLHIESHF